jgi:hypothetical protein
MNTYVYISKHLYSVYTSLSATSSSENSSMNINLDISTPVQSLIIMFTYIINEGGKRNLYYILHINQPEKHTKKDQ